MQSLKGAARNLWHFDITSSSLFTLMTLFWGLFYFAIYVMWGESPIADWFTLLLSLSLVALVCISITFLKKTTSYDIFIILVFFMHLHFFPRIGQYFASRQENLKLLYILFPKHWNSEMINQGLVYVVLGSLSLILGMICAEKLFHKTSGSTTVPANLENRNGTLTASLLSLTLAGVVIYGIDGYYTIYLGLSAASNCDFEVWGKWLIHFFSGDIYVFAVIVLLASHFKERTWGQKLFLIGSLIIYLAYMLALGSRGGAFRLFTIFVCLAVALGRDFKVKTTTLAIVVPALIIFSSSLFSFGSSVREARRYNCGEKMNIDFSRKDPYADSYVTEQKYIRKFDGDERNSKRILLPPKLARIMDRMGLMDYPLGIVSSEAHAETAEKYLNFKYASQNILNNLVLGSPFPDAEIMTNRMFPMIFRGHDLKHVEENFVAEPFTIWGLSFLFFGLIGGLLFQFLSSFLLQLFYMLGTNRFTNLKLGFKVFCIWIVANGGVFFNMGFDHAGTILAYAFIQLATTLALICGFDYFINRFRPLASTEGK